MENLEKSLGYCAQPRTPDQIEKMIQYVNLKLTALGFSSNQNQETGTDFLEIAKPLLSSHHEKGRLLAGYLCPADRRIQDFLNDYLKDVPGPMPQLPADTFILDRHGLARIISLPLKKDSFVSDIVHSYRIKQGILHNPKSDRRTTQGVFHVVEGGYPIPDDKLAVPKIAFKNMLALALTPPGELKRLPFTSAQERKAELFVSLLLRPTVCPEVPGYIPSKSLEIRFFAPGNLVGNLDFVESIFGNAGDPYLPENDAALDVDHWTGHTGCVILAPHLIHATKKSLGLPHFDQATERQKRDGMCWKDENELYNNGTAFKATCRNEKGVIATIIADNYFGYCKKEVKTQISFSANLYGLAEEEHSGGAIAFPSYDLGEDFSLMENTLPQNNRTFKEVVETFGSLMSLQPEGYGVDKKYVNILYVPEDAKFSLATQSVTWKKDKKEQKIKLLAYHTYLLPSGYKIEMRKHANGSSWHLVGTVGEGTLCHKPCTVSGGGKSEISKSIADAMLQGPIFVSDFHKDMDMVTDIMSRDFGNRFKEPFRRKKTSRPILSQKRSLGSVIKLFTPSAEYSDKYNTWLASLPPHLKEIIYVVKRYYKPEWGENWREYFGVDMINGSLGHELKFGSKKLVANYLRVGREKDGSWRIYKLRQDYNASDKLQVEDDISASVVIPRNHLQYLNPHYKNPSIKLVRNCEYRLFQRPDDAIYRGYDKQAEEDIASPDAFLSNYEPLTLKDAKEILEDAVGFDLYTEPVKNLIRQFIKDGAPTYFVSSAHPRVFEGKPSKNPRYLQNRQDILNPRMRYLAEIATRLFRFVPMDKPVHFPVNAVLPGRRNNPPDRKTGIPPLAVYNPIHYQELPELFMDFICSVTGKSPSTTGFGSEGALTKGPFNAMWPIIDLNNALVSYILTGYQGFSSAAGYVGPKFRVDHDISLLIPEIWCRMSVAEREPAFLIEHGYLEKLKDFNYRGEKVTASILGYRITIRFVHAFLGRIFNNPNALFSTQMLAPEKQDMALFVEGINNIAATQKRVAEYYFKDGSICAACPPLKALLHIMAYGHYEDKDRNHPEIRKMFERQSLLESGWYQERLRTKQKRDIALYDRFIKYLEPYEQQPANPLPVKELLTKAKKLFTSVSNPSYLKHLEGTLGADPFESCIRQ